MDYQQILSNDTLQKSKYKQVDAEDLKALQSIVGDKYATQDKETLENYSHDWTEDFVYPPEVVVRPGTAEEVANVLKYCNDQLIPVTAAGGRTGLSAGMIPIFGGISLGLERLNNIIQIDTRNLQATCESGVITQVLQEACEEHGLFYPPDPSSKGSSFMGGNVAANAGGIQAVKYGITKDYVLDLEVATVDGELIKTGAPVLKNSTGYNLTQLMIGSEGTLGVVTKVTVKLESLPEEDATLLAPFASLEAACDCVSTIFQSGLRPTAIEFMEAEAVRYTQEYIGNNTFDLEGVGAHLVIKVDGKTMDGVMDECEALMTVLEENGATDVFFAEDDQKKEDLWRTRRTIAEAVKARTVKKGLDTVVPRAEMANVIRYVKEVGDEYGFHSICFGHAGDGNLHVNILKNDLSDEWWQEVLPEVSEKIFRYVHSLGGTLSAEHGVGWVQRRYMDIVFSDYELQLMKGIKNVFDPKGILNPGKIFPM